MEHWIITVNIQIRETYYDNFILETIAYAANVFMLFTEKMSLLMLEQMNHNLS